MALASSQGQHFFPISSWSVRPTASHASVADSACCEPAPKITAALASVALSKVRGAAPVFHGRTNGAAR